MGITMSSVFVLSEEDGTEHGIFATADAARRQVKAIEDKRAAKVRAMNEKCANPYMWQEFPYDEDGWDVARMVYMGTYYIREEEVRE